MTKPHGKNALALAMAIVLSTTVLTAGSLAKGKDKAKDKHDHAESRWDRFDDDNRRNGKWDDDEFDRRRIGQFRNDNYELTDLRREALRDLIMGRRQSSILDDRLRRDILDRRSSGLESLPPGIRKNLRRGKPIPPGIAKQMTPLPNSILPYLGWQDRDDLRVGVYGRDVYAYNPRTNMIWDVVRDLLR